MGSGAYHAEGEGGPHAVWVHDPNIPSDICEKLGMLAGTFHDHLDQKFQLMTEPSGEEEVIEEEKVPEDLQALAQEVKSLKERVAKLEAKLKGLRELLE